ncbi:MAG: B12-binding domain-containing radical SAM protein [Planctomycetes bacterium]|nr:B12-binding domain-containing radical SAM protein [Planctomycetota bacterium]
MTPRSIVFIEPTGNRTNVFDNYMRLPLLGSLYLGTILEKHGYDVRIVNENILGRQLDPFDVKADVYCITALTVSANRARLLASQLKSLYPDSLVIVGGIHASLLPEDFADVADHVVIGEAEGVILDLVEGRCTDRIVQGVPPQDLEDLPLVNYRLLEGYETIDTVPVMTSRGCPFDCNFCTVTRIFGRKFRMQSPERIIAEIENALDCFKSRTFFFYDDNFSADRNRVDRLCDLIIDRKLDISWAAQVRSDLARDPELVDKMVAAGLRWVYVGFESIDDATLKAMHKSQTRADIEKAISVLHRAGVNIHGMFIFGEDHDTVESVAATARFAIDNRIDTVQFMILTPFPGTRCYDDIVAGNRLLHRDWDFYNGMFPVFQPKNMSPSRLISETYKAYSAFYSIRRTLLDTLYLFVNVFLDALVWNFGRADRYNLDTVFLRGGAKTIVLKYSDIYNSYVNYLDALEKERLLKRGSPS